MHNRVEKDRPADLMYNDRNDKSLFHPQVTVIRRYLLSIINVE